MTVVRMKNTTAIALLVMAQSLPGLTMIPTPSRVVPTVRSIAGHGIRKYHEQDRQGVSCD